ncbi:hypothetical protein BMS3Bbin07_01054 [bacterium BMS3Bbin07]|nr:hypothetical protein BMS3Bbin07_01054 [bacterium BMS3Bbin07]
MAPLSGGLQCKDLEGGDKTIPAVETCFCRVNLYKERYIRIKGKV